MFLVVLFVNKKDVSYYLQCVVSLYYSSMCPVKKLIKKSLLEKKNAGSRYFQMIILYENDTQKSI